MEAVAARAGVSKVTLYSYYPDKTALFRAAMQMEMDRIEAGQQAAGAGDDAAAVADQLRGFGLGLMAFLTSPPATDFYSVIAGELRRHQDLARAFWDLGPGATRQRLAALIARGAERGELAIGDPNQAAEDLFGLWQGFSNFQLALSVDAAQVRAGLAERVGHGVSVFMRLYGRHNPAASGEPP